MQIIAFNQPGKHVCLILSSVSIIPPILSNQLPFFSFVLSSSFPFSVFLLLPLFLRLFNFILAFFFFYSFELFSILYSLFILSDLGYCQSSQTLAIYIPTHLWTLECDIDFFQTIFSNQQKGFLYCCSVCIIY